MWRNRLTNKPPLDSFPRRRFLGKPNSRATSTSFILVNRSATFQIKRIVFFVCVSHEKSRNITGRAIQHLSCCQTGVRRRPKISRCGRFCEGRFGFPGAGFKVSFFLFGVAWVYISKEVPWRGFLESRGGVSHMLCDTAGIDSVNDPPPYMLRSHVSICTRVNTE